MRAAIVAPAAAAAPVLALPPIAVDPAAALPLVPTVQHLCLDVPTDGLSPAEKRGLTLAGSILGIISGMAVTAAGTYAELRQALAQP